MASQRIDRALSERIYLLEAYQSEEDWRFRVRGQSNNVYDARFTPTEFHCSCPDHTKTNGFCKHLLYIICRIGVQMEIGLKVSTRRTNWNPDRYRACSTAWALKLRNRIRVETAAAIEDEPAPSGDCVICFDALDGETVECRTTCHNRFHRECMDKWLESGHATCPMCRADWVRETSATLEVSEEITGTILEESTSATENVISDNSSSLRGHVVSDILFTFDTTGSMYPCLMEVKRNISEVARRLFQEIPDLRIAVIAHGDYCDKDSPYLTKQLDFTNDPDRIVGFIDSIESTYGGDYPEAYEYVLRESRKLSWRIDATTKGIVMIGDAPPHEPYENPERIDWREEADRLRDRNVQIYSVQCLNNGNRDAFTFYSSIAERTNGYHLFLDQFSYIKDLIEAVCYRQYDASELEAFERAVQTRNGGLSEPMRLLFDTMLGRKTRAEVAAMMEPARYRERYSGGSRSSRSSRASTSTAVPSTEEEDELHPCPPTKFQVFTVEHDVGIKEFCTDMGIRFRTGRGFYEFTKRETVQARKEIVLMKRATGELFEGHVARRIAGIPDGEATLIPGSLPEYRVFIQSTSANRKLLRGQGFLYEVDYA